VNGFAIVFLVALVAESCVWLAAQAAEVRSLRAPVPEEFRDVIDETTYFRTQAYARSRARVGLAASALDLAVVLAFWLAGGFGWWDEWVRAAGWGTVGTGLLFVGGLMAGHSALSLPLGVYSTFVVEKRFGFNLTTPRTYLLDLLKGLVMGLAIGGPLLAGVIWLLSHSGRWPFAVLFAAGVFITVLLQYVVPVWIMPLFNTFRPLETGEVREAVLSYAARTHFPIQSVYVVDGSRRSTKANAYFTGFGRNKRLALYDTLLARHAPDEVLAVVAHEVGHYRLRHVLWGMLAGFAELGLGVLALALLVARPELFGAFYVSNPSVYAGLLLTTLFLGPFAQLVSVPLLALSRHDEYQADAYAVHTAGGPGPMTRALKRLAADSLTHLTPAPLHVWLNFSHPPMAERVRALARGLPDRAPGHRPEQTPPSG
jgi:STE24 endopeptidase